MAFSACEIPHKNHDYEDWKIEIAPTCIAEGLETRFCKKSKSILCEQTRIIPIDSNAHDFEWITAIPAHCGESNSSAQFCKHCNVMGESWAGPVIEHEWEYFLDVYMGLEPCWIGEINIAKCNICGEYKTEIIDTHEWDPDVTEIEMPMPICIEQSIDINTCLRCDAKKTIVIEEMQSGDIIGNTDII